jgi:hypothetical protein
MDRRVYSPRLRGHATAVPSLPKKAAAHPCAPILQCDEAGNVVHRKIAHDLKLWPQITGPP